MKPTQNYRGVMEILGIKVHEGDGTPEYPSQLTEYVAQKDRNGVWRTYGKIVPLTEEERGFIG